MDEKQRKWWAKISSKPLQEVLAELNEVKEPEAKIYLKGNPFNQVEVSFVERETQKGVVLAKATQDCFTYLGAAHAYVPDTAFLLALLFSVREEKEVKQAACATYAIVKRGERGQSKLMQVVLPLLAHAEITGVQLAYHIRHGAPLLPNSLPLELFVRPLHKIQAEAYGFTFEVGKKKGSSGERLWFANPAPKYKYRRVKAQEAESCYPKINSFLSKFRLAYAPTVEEWKKFCSAFSVFMTETGEVVAYHVYVCKNEQVQVKAALLLFTTNLTCLDLGYYEATKEGAAMFYQHVQGNIQKEGLQNKRCLQILDPIHLSFWKYDKLVKAEEILLLPL